MNVLASALSETMARATTDLVVLDPDRRTWVRHPWQEVHARSENVADRVIGDGAQAVGLVGDPTVEFIASIPGVLFAGAAVSILPGPVRGADPEQWARATMARFRAIGVDTVMSHGAPLHLLRGVDDGLAVHDVAAVAHSQRSMSFHAPKDGGDTAILQGTAGSTGTPRTARVSGAAALANFRGLQSRVGITSDDRGHSWLPIYHDMGLAFLLMGAVGDVETWQAPTAAFAASPFSWLTWLTASRATVTAAPNMTYTLLGKYSSRVRDVDLGDLRFALNGGEPVDCDGVERFAAEMTRFGFDPGALCPSYGLAESTCAVTVPAPGDGLRVDEIDGGPDQLVRRHAVLGEAIPGMELRLRPIDDGGAELPGREVGEIEIRGSSLMSGYVDQQPIDREQWLSTGDLGYLVDDSLVVCGRIKELITVAGRNIFPAEVERVAALVKGVRDGAVIAVGTTGSATRQGLVITAEFRGRDEAAARTELVRRVASECGVVPADVVFVKPGSLPRTSSGKLRRLEVKRDLEGANR